MQSKDNYAYFVTQIISDTFFVKLLRITSGKIREVIDVWDMFKLHESSLSEYEHLGCCH